ncbi:MAG: hypothetical protein JKX98_12630 [Alcanivoracaceae bacterium]|nr:hypothetical protein [Alcanivoracaceae bacterium]
MRDATSSGIETISADAMVLLRNVLIDNNTLVPGAVAGGVGIFQGKTNLVMIDTIISNNSAKKDACPLCIYSFKIFGLCPSWYCH